MLTVRREPYPLSDAFRSAWADLRAGVPGGSVFTDLAWIEAGIHHALPVENAPIPLRFDTADGTTVAMALLQQATLRDRLGPLRSLRSIEINSQRIPPVLAPDVDTMAAALTALWQHAGDTCDVIDLFKLDPMDGRLAGLREALEKNGIRARLRPFNQQPRLVLPATTDELLRLRNKVSRKKLRWGRNRLEGLLGPLELVRLRSPDEHARFGAVELRRALFQVAGRSWQGKEGTSPGQAQIRAFYSEVQDAFAPRGMLDVCLLRAKDRFLAFDLNLVEHGCVYMLAGAYDPEWHRFSPGSQLFVQWAADSLTRGDRVLEFGGDYLEYKEHWASECVSSHHLRLFGRTPRGRLKALLARWR